LKKKRHENNLNKIVGVDPIHCDKKEDTQYYFENGLRKVYPYDFTWTTNCKERWTNRTLYDIYSKEFTRAIRNLSLDHMISSGRIRVNDEIKDKNYLLKNGDKITHKHHRHEIPVTARKIKIIHEDDDFLVINKPSSIPIHPCGKYRYNSLINILAKDMGYSNLRSNITQFTIYLF
jgi:23S rRNA-/tRNA-specific pseudouridylate synthase